MTPARRERHLFADALLAAGPDAPTLCEGWTTRDLAAHVVVRDRRPDTLPGVLLKWAGAYTEKVRLRKAADEYTSIVEQVRTGPPLWSPAHFDFGDRLINTTEFFVHLEDVRRAASGWEPRQLDEALVTDLRAALGRSAKLFARKAPAAFTLEPDDGTSPVVAKAGSPMVTVSGPVGELVLFMFGRQAHAQVEIDGPADAAEALRTASFGI
jgi:uncharacterized protein (TIGR03085 family)